MSRKQAVQAPTLAVGALPPALTEPTDLDVAISVAQQLLDSDSVLSMREALRLLLRALDAEPTSNFLGSQEVPERSRPQGWTDVMTVQVPGDRCPAAHPEDPTPCGGPVVVTILDKANAGANGCEHHGARLLASLDRSRVHGLPHAEPGTAIRVFKAAAGIRPFCWYEDAQRTQPSQLSAEENRRRGESQ